jgi:hypothetical protein
MSLLCPKFQKYVPFLPYYVIVSWQIGICPLGITYVQLATLADASGEHLVLAGHDMRKAFESLIQAAMLLCAAKRGVIPSYTRTLSDMHFRILFGIFLLVMIRTENYIA